MNQNIRYDFSAKMWQHDSPGGWFFVSIPIEMSKEIRTNLSFQEEGWGRMKTRAKIGDIEWESAIWYDSKSKTYLLPIKSKIRKLVKLNTTENINLTIYL